MGVMKAYCSFRSTTVGIENLDKKAKSASPRNHDFATFHAVISAKVGA